MLLQLGEIVIVCVIMIFAIAFLSQILITLSRKVEVVLYKISEKG